MISPRLRFRISRKWSRIGREAPSQESKIRGLCLCSVWMKRENRNLIECLMRSITGSTRSLYGAMFLLSQIRTVSGKDYKGFAGSTLDSTPYIDFIFMHFCIIIIDLIKDYLFEFIDQILNNFGIDPDFIIE